MTELIICGLCGKKHGPQPSILCSKLMMVPELTDLEKMRAMALSELDALKEQYRKLRDAAENARSYLRNCDEFLDNLNDGHPEIISMIDQLDEALDHPMTQGTPINEGKEGKS